MKFMTEEEAKTKFCPLTNSTVIYASRCVASGCMMWRKAEWPMLAEADESDTRRELDRMNKSGYCGLAGKP